MPARPDTDVPNLRQVAVARAYVQGLEADRERLKLMERTVQEQTWEVVKLGSYNRALVRALSGILADMSVGAYEPELWDRAELLVADSKLLYESVFPCACGHSKWDHDEDGCVYLGCKNICG